MSTRSNSFDKIGLVLLALVLGLVVWKLQRPPGAMEVAVEPGTPLPALKVDGWLNLPAGESFDPSGKIVVMDFWATYCGPCEQEMPHLAALAKRYRPLGVEFVGLTEETSGDVPQITAFIERTPGFNWPVGYGAMHVMAQLNIRAFPTLVIFGPDGKARKSWLGANPHGVEAAIEELLAAQPSSESDSESAKPNAG